MGLITGECDQYHGVRWQRTRAFCYAGHKPDALAVLTPTVTPAGVEFAALRDLLLIDRTPFPGLELIPSRGHFHQCTRTPVRGESP
jgi:hypothetical protein